MYRKHIFMILLLFCSYGNGYAIDKFDIQVCEAQGSNADKIKCYSGLQLDALCKGFQSSKRLACLRKSSQERVLEKKKGSVNKSKGWKHSGMIGKMDMILIDKDKEMDQDIYRLAIGAVCAGKHWCKVLFWSDPALVPKRFPMTDAQVKGQTASWIYNGNNGYRRLFWACRIVNDPNQCFSN